MYWSPWVPLLKVDRGDDSSPKSALVDPRLSCVISNHSNPSGFGGVLSKTDGDALYSNFVIGNNLCELAKCWSGMLFFSMGNDMSSSCQITEWMVLAVWSLATLYGVRQPALVATHSAVRVVYVIRWLVVKRFVSVSCVLCLTATALPPLLLTHRQSTPPSTQSALSSVMVGSKVGRCPCFLQQQQQPALSCQPQQQQRGVGCRRCHRVVLCSHKGVAS